MVPVKPGTVKQRGDGSESSSRAVLSLFSGGGWGGAKVSGVVRDVWLRLVKDADGKNPTTLMAFQGHAKELISVVSTNVNLVPITKTDEHVTTRLL